MTTDPTTTAPSVVLHAERASATTETRAVERVVLRRRVISEVRQVEVLVRREVLEVERSPLDVAAGEAGAGAHEPLVIELREEVPEVTLHAQPYERVRVRVEQVREQASVVASVQREQVDVAYTGDAAADSGR